MLENLSPDESDAALQVELVAHKLLEHVNQPVCSRRQHYSTPSIGAALFGCEPLQVDELLKRVDLAMYEAKAGGRNTLRFFDSVMWPRRQRPLFCTWKRICARHGAWRVLRALPARGRCAWPPVRGGGLLRWQHPQRGTW